MWWLYVYLSENDSVITYGYSRESDNADGMIKYSKAEKKIVLFTPCTADKESNFCISVAKSKFITFVVDEGYPKRRKVVTG